jgi:hypothetical protein
MLSPLGYRGGAASHLRAADCTLAVRSEIDRRPLTASRAIDFHRNVATTLPERSLAAPCRPVGLAGCTAGGVNGQVDVLYRGQWG